MRQLTILLVLLLATTARADKPKRPLDAATRAQASEHVKQADEFLKTSQWDKAIAEYQAALDLTDEPLMIFNIALANDRAGRPEAALESFRRYLAIAPAGPVADEAREDVARLVPVVDKIQAERAATKAQADAAAREVAQQRADEDRKRAAAAAQRERADRADAGARRLRWIALGTGVVGLAGVGVGAKFGLDARAAAKDVTAHTGGWTDMDLVRDSEGRSAQTKQIVFTAIGGAVIAAGVVVYLLSARSHHRAERMRAGITF